MHVIDKQHKTNTVLFVVSFGKHNILGMPSYTLTCYENNYTNIII